jgi:hypothetical protein
MSSLSNKANSVDSQTSIVSNSVSFEGIANVEKHKCLSWRTKIFYSFGHIFNGK